MTIANVTATTDITSAWGNSVADQVNINSPAITAAQADADDGLSRIGRGVYALGTVIAQTAGSPGFASGTAYHISNNTLTLTRPAWSTGNGFLIVTISVNYTTDANAALVNTSLAYRMNATGSWNFINDVYITSSALTASTTSQPQCTAYLTVSGPTDYVEISPGGQKVSGAGNVTINTSGMVGQMLWVPSS